MKKLVRNLHLGLLHHQYKSGEHADILKAVKYFYNVKSKYSVYKNIFRILSLKAEGNSAWRPDYEFLNQQNLLDVFERDEKQYILIFLQNKLFDEINSPVEHEIDLSLVSERTKKYFSLKSKNW